MPPPSFNFKQKLAALSQAQSSPSSPHSTNYAHTRNGNGTDSYAHSPTSPTSKRKMFFNTWVKRPLGSFGHDSGDPPYAYGDEERRMVQEVLSKMIFQAGVDFETRPMVVLNASALPDPQVVSYDLLLSRILSYLNLYVEADYTVVFFAAGSKHAPSWNWVWKAYRSLSRKYRKNLKQLYIVHSSFFSKMLFSLAGAIISPKFFRKIMYINTLSELAQHVPLTQIDIPPAVYQENLKYERKITLPVPMRSSVFGVPLEDLMGYNGEKGGVPRVVKDAAQFLRDTGMRDEGLFRRSPSSALLRAAQDAYDRGNVVSLDTFGDPHLAAVLLKKYLRDLPEPVFPESVYGIIRRCPATFGEVDEEAEQTSIRYIRDTLLPELVPCAYILLSYVLHLLHDVSLRSDSNRMDAFNLSIVICPNLVKSSSPVRDVLMCSVPISTSVSGTSTMSGGSLASSYTQDSSTSSPTLSGAPEGKATLGMVVALCIRRYYEIFDEVVDRSEPVAPWRALRMQGAGAEGDGASDDSGGSGQNMYVLGDDDDLDDEVLVMPVGPEGQQYQQQRAHGHASTPSMGQRTKRHRNTQSNGSNGPSAAAAARSMFNVNDASGSGSPSAWHNTSGGGHGHTVRSSAPNVYPTNGKARSMISIEGSGSAIFGGASRKGSISIGRGTTRKGSGAAVEAVSVVAEGFFTPPGGAPPVPRLPSSPTTTRARSRTLGSEQREGEEEEERTLTVGERRRMFENGGAR